MMKNKLAAILAGTTLAIIGGISVANPKAANAEQLPQTTWNCYRNADHVGKVTIWWGHTTEDAKWACNEWISPCKEADGCSARPAN